MARRYRRRARTVHPLAWFVLALVIVLALISWFYAIVQQPFWQERSAAQQEILEHTHMRQIDSFFPFVGDSAYNIAIGSDENGRELVVWMEPTETEEGSSQTEEGSKTTSAERFHTAYLDENFSETDIKAKLLASHPDATIIRIMPGIYDDIYAWEVFFEVEEKKGMQFYYMYYRFNDGEPLDLYRVPALR